MKKIILIIASMFLLGFSSQATAGTMPYDIGHITDFLDNTLYFKGYSEITTNYDFTGKWHYTAIGFESGNINTTKEDTATESTTFSTGNTGAFGIWDTIDFSGNNNLYFGDDDPINIPLNPFIGSSSKFFRLYELTADSKQLDYLFNPIALKAGSIIVGFNDNGVSGGDSDFDDIIVALEYIQNPEPATMLLFGFGLMGLAGIARRKQ